MPRSKPKVAKRSWRSHPSVMNVTDQVVVMASRMRGTGSSFRAADDGLQPALEILLLLDLQIAASLPIAQ